MTTFWDDMPNDAELELWWVAETEHTPPERAAEVVGAPGGRAAEMVERVESFLQQAARGAEDFAVRRRPRGGKWTEIPQLSVSSVDDLETLAAWAAWQLLDSLCERPTVRVTVKGDTESTIRLKMRKARPQRENLLTLIRLGRLRRELVAVAALRRPSERRAPSGPRPLRPPGAA